MTIEYASLCAAVICETRVMIAWQARRGGLWPQNGGVYRIRCIMTNDTANDGAEC